MKFYVYKQFKVNPLTGDITNGKWVTCKWTSYLFYLAIGAKTKMKAK